MIYNGFNQPNPRKLYGLRHLRNTPSAHPFIKKQSLKPPSFSGIPHQIFFFPLPEFYFAQVVKNLLV